MSLRVCGCGGKEFVVDNVVIVYQRYAEFKITEDKASFITTIYFTNRAY